VSPVFALRTLQKIVVRGGAKLRGEIAVSGAKNAALPIFASSLLVAGRSTYRNVPDLGDVLTMRRLLAALGAPTRGRGGTLQIDARTVSRTEVPYDLVSAMRASVLVLGPLLGRCGEARVPLPGGCTIGARPIDQHLKGLEALGAKISLEHGTVCARARRLRGARIGFDLVTVTGTENLMMAAALAQGRTTLENCACEPEVEELGRVLNKMGAKVHGAGTSLVTIEGVDELFPIDHAIIPDRIEAGTLMIAAAITGGNLLLANCVPEHVEAVSAKLRAAGAEITIEPGGVRVRGHRETAPADVVTRPHPGFPTDLQAQFMVLMTRAAGPSVLTETIFESRFMHVPELCRMGAAISIEGRTAMVRGPSRLKGAQVMATDLRASASLVLAGLVAEGTTEILHVHHLDRGYERLDRKLRAAGADIRRARVGTKDDES
jgi:UDP-N-acetylglucosamine 1-carboxyvinyltransferase